jgi:hypothetical protein
MRFGNSHITLVRATVTVPKRLDRRGFLHTRNLSFARLFRAVFATNNSDRRPLVHSPSVPSNMVPKVTKAKPAVPLMSLRPGFGSARVRVRLRAEIQCFCDTNTR